ncbi:MAG: ATP-binding cassette domain-containing protein [Cytophagaceae bacterium]|nr:ATP-binding cassette domain-containing protein [Cytophagaceae bacterium]
MKNKVLEADSIWLEYGGRKILQNIYLRLETGRVTGLLGRNGCGKSCLMQVIYGARMAANCSVRLDGRYQNQPYRQRGLLAYLPQHTFVPGQVRVAEAFRLYEVPVAQALAGFPELENTVGMRFGDLSGRERRILEALLILHRKAAFVLLDEPFSMLMPLHVERLMNLITQQKPSKGFLIADHRYREVLALSDAVYLLNQEGRSMLLTNPVEQLKDRGYLNQG